MLLSPHLTHQSGLNLGLFQNFMNNTSKVSATKSDGLDTASSGEAHKMKFIAIGSTRFMNYISEDDE